MGLTFQSRWNKLLFFSITCLGISHIITQLTLLRELLAIFSGNELTIGIILANWMLLTGLGAYLGRFFRSQRLQLNTLLMFQVTAAFLPVLAVFIIRMMRDKIFIRGELLGLTSIFSSTLVLLLPYCLFTGILLTVACSLFSFRDKGKNIGTVYFLDNIGDILGGSLFSFVLIYFFDSFRILYFPAALNLVAAILLGSLSRRKLFSVTVIMLTAVFFVFVSMYDLDDFSIRRLYEGQDVVLHKDSRYGKLVVTRLEDQYNFFENGFLLYSTDDIIRAEETVHYAMAQTESPRRVLLISGGITGTAKEILKHGVERVDYVELDAQILAIGREYTDNLDDDRINTISMDGRLFVERARDKYDAVILDLPDPATVQTNRMYTVEFFQSVKSVLKKDGVISTSISSSENFPRSRDVAPLSKALYSTLKEVFSNVIIIPGDTSYYIASESPLTHDVIERLDEKGVPTEYVKYYAGAKLTRERIEGAEEAARGGVVVNRDFRPLICYYTLRYWLSQFGTPVRIFVVAAGAALLIYLAFMRAVPFAVFTTGFAAAGLEIVILIGFQVLYGYVYHKIGVIITMFMIGLAIGSFTVNRSLERRNLGTMVKVQFAVVMLSVALPFVLMGLARFTGVVLGFAGANLVIPLVTVAVAFLVGFEFPLAAKLFGKDIPRTAGTLYCADLIGASAGAITVSAGLIPLVGLVYTCLLVGGLNAVSGGILVFKRLRS